MLSTGRLFFNSVRKVTIPTLSWTTNIQRSVSTMSNMTHSTPFQLLSHNVKETQPSISHYVSRLSPFSAPPAPQPLSTPFTQVQETFELTSVLRKRRLKMNKHKHKKLRKRTRALRKRLGK